MPRIGRFEPREQGFAGHIHTLTLSFDLAIVPNRSADTVNAPDYRLHQGTEDGPGIGAAWKRSSEKAGEYLSVLLDGPALPRPIRASLFCDDEAGALWSLHWGRQKQRDMRGRGNADL